MEKTFVLFKPDCMQKPGVLGKVMTRFEEAGLRLIALKMVRLDDGILQVHYAHHAQKPFFPELREFMKETPVVLSVWEGDNAIQKVRDLAGPTDSKKAAKGTIRGDFGTDVQRNIVHASDSPESAEAEIKRFFSEKELCEW
ncbi:MAG: nucleoside-diphosphate kinase [Candidatus Micrarchaeota archaeon]